MRTCIGIWLEYPKISTLQLTDAIKQILETELNTTIFEVFDGTDDRPDPDSNDLAKLYRPH